ncbi:MAG: PH domain-containing protein [Deltaproteobacteria bacterium]|nr:PH domain-containing protein [Deltaproteobacteria bacterium]
MSTTGEKSVSVIARVAKTRRRVATLLSLGVVTVFASVCSMFGVLGLLSHLGGFFWVLFLGFSVAVFAARRVLQGFSKPREERLTFDTDGTLSVGAVRYDWRDVRWSDRHEGPPERLELGLGSGETIRFEMPEGSLKNINTVVPLDALRSVMKLREARAQFLSYAFVLPVLLLMAMGSAVRHAEPSLDAATAVVSLAAAIALFWVFHTRFLGVDVTVGADGVLLRTLLFSRLIRWKSIDRLTMDTLYVHLHLRDGRSRRVWLGHDRGPSAHVVVDRIKTALQRSRQEASRQARDALARGNRSFDQWQQDLQELANLHANYRATVISDESLRAVLQDGESTTELRMAAALVLRARHGDAVSTELRAVADALVDPTAQSALRVVTENTLDPVRIESALLRVKNQ